MDNNSLYFQAKQDANKTGSGIRLWGPFMLSEQKDLYHART